MPELRKDYILDRYVIIATERAKRPDQFKGHRKEQERCEDCYFCPGHEDNTPSEILRIERDGRWLIRAFPNKYSAVLPAGNPYIRTADTFFTYADAYGFHEVIVETPDHYAQLWDLPAWHLKELLKVYSSRVEVLSSRPGVRYVCVFKNSGEDAGTSILHTHSQVIACNLVPLEVQELEKASQDSCPYCRIIEIEKRSDRRCFEDEHISAFTPYASRFAFEIQIVPKRHVTQLVHLHEEELDSLAGMLQKALLRLRELNASYNLLLHYGVRNSHLRLTIAPRLARWAGFELSSGMIINSMPPEKAAEFYRS